MGTRQPGMYSTADAVIRTWSECDPRNASCELKTEVVYRWASEARWHTRVRDARLMCV